MAALWPDNVAALVERTAFVQMLGRPPMTPRCHVRSIASDRKTLHCSARLLAYQ